MNEEILNAVKEQALAAITGQDKSKLISDTHRTQVGDKFYTFEYVVNNKTYDVINIKEVNTFL